MDKTTTVIMKDSKSLKDIEIIIIDKNTYYDLTNGIGCKVIKSY